MELVRRMKTATTTPRSALLLSLVASLTLSAGLAPLGTTAQEQPGRTIATGSNIPLSASAPDEYIVKPGDTLWDISKVFLRDAWFWPEIWYVNPQVQNPHLIYPGDVLKLVYVEGQPRVTLAERSEGGGGKRLSPQVRREELSQAITAIPYDIIASFVGRPTLLTEEQVRSGPYIVAMRDGHVIGGVGNEIYTRGMGNAALDDRYSVIHVEEKIRDPDTNDLLGYTGVYVGSGPVATVGDPAKILLTDTTREALQGDKLFPESVDVNLDFLPHAPSSSVDAAVIAVRSHTILGQYNVVALNRGTAAGLEAGHVLAVFQRGEAVRDSYSKGGLGAGASMFSSKGGGRVQMPEERAGVIMVFKAYDKMSYGLVMESTHPIRQGDRARNP
jgi:hypothetical protein